MNKENKNTIGAGLAGLCNAPSEPLPEVTVTKTTKKRGRPGRPKKDIMQVCYAISPDLETKVKYMAYYDRTTKNGIVEKALREYWAKWQEQATISAPMSYEDFEAVQEEEKEGNV